MINLISLLILMLLNMTVVFVGCVAFASFFGLLPLNAKLMLSQFISTISADLNSSVGSSMPTFPFWYGRGNVRYQFGQVSSSEALDKQWARSEKSLDYFRTRGFAAL